MELGEVAPRPVSPRRVRKQDLIRLGVVVAVIALTLSGVAVLHAASRQATSLSYANFMADADAGKLASVTINNSSGVITGQFSSGSSYTANGPIPSSPMALAVLRTRDHIAVQQVGTTPILRPAHPLRGRAALLGQH